MSDKVLIAISCEAHLYHSWQAAVLTYSCLQWQGVAPLLVVHGADEGDLPPYYLDASRAGAWIVHAKNYRDHGDREEHWAARNTAAAMVDAARVGRKIGAETIVIMDPDIVWTRKVTWPTEFAVDKCSLGWIHEDRALAVADVLGLDVPVDAHERFGSRVPYVVPIDLAGPLGHAWWRVMEVYYELGDWEWSDQMVAFALAMISLEVKPERRRFSQTNHGGSYKAPPEAPLIHYAYETPYWDKRLFVNEDSPAWDELWKPTRLPLDSVQGWVGREIARARRFYDCLGVSV